MPNMKETSVEMVGLEEKTPSLPLTWHLTGVPPRGNGSSSASPVPCLGRKGRAWPKELALANCNVRFGHSISIRTGSPFFSSASREAFDRKSTFSTLKIWGLGVGGACVLGGLRAALSGYGCRTFAVRNFGKITGPRNARFKGQAIGSPSGPTASNRLGRVDCQIPPQPCGSAIRVCLPPLLGWLPL